MLCGGYWYGRWGRVKLSISVTPNLNQTKLLILFIINDLLVKVRGVFQD